MKPTLKTTISFIKKAHAGQKYGSDPYWIHPLKVAETGKMIFGSKFDKTAYIAALLHDVIEDTKYDRTYLENMGYGTDVVDSVELLTKDKKLDYEANISRIIKSKNKTAMMVKFADNFENFTGDKSHWDPKRAEKSQAKYLKSMQELAKVLGIDLNHYLPSN